MNCSQNHICETEQKSGGDKRIQQKDLDFAQKYWADCIESRGSIAYSHLMWEIRNPSTFHQILVFVNKNQDVRY